jgi:hypothetical protein
MSRRSLGLLCVALWGCPEPEAPELDVPTHSALISIQNVEVAGREGSLLTVQASFTPLRRPDFEEKPGQPDGCKAWLYDLERERPPAAEDHGTLVLDGVTKSQLRCTFDAERGYVCPGTGPSEGHPFAPRVHVALEPGGGRAFLLPEVDLVPGAPFTLDAASRLAIIDLPLAATSLGCAECGNAPLTIVRITTTDAPLVGPDDMPTPRRRYVEISCASIGATTVNIPAEAMSLLQRAHADSPLTRIRTAYMRDGFAQLVSEAPAPPNRATIAVGHGVIGYTNMR